MRLPGLDFFIVAIPIPPVLSAAKRLTARRGLRWAKVRGAPPVALASHSHLLSFSLSGLAGINGRSDCICSRIEGSASSARIR